jgi:SAM-dependent methyltransferase
MDAAFWDERYGSRDAAPSSDPNPQLAAEAADLPAGVALDVGTGEGDDAVWLAARGWTVTAVDISQVALDRGKAAAAARGVADRITWVQADLVNWTPPARAFDLVSAQFVHFLPAERKLVFERLAAAVREGGTLLVVGHHPSDLETTAKRWNMPDAFHTAEDLAQLLDPRDWKVTVAASRPRDVVDPNGDPIVVHDTVLRARRSLES